MPFKISWDNDQQTTIRVDYSEPLLWEEVLASQKGLNQEIDSVTYPVSIILDFSQLNKLPLGAISGFKDVVKNFHPRTEFSVLVGMNPFIRLFEKTFKGIFKAFGIYREQTAFFAKNLEEARSLIHQARLARDRQIPTSI